jgi:hypothetical protein
MQRIYVIGGPGSGKTTLARRLAAQGSLALYELDAIGYDGGAGPKRPLSSKLAEVSRIAAQPAWIAEGVFLWWTDELLQRADVIVWLDFPWRLAAWRIVLRHVRASLGGTNPHRGLRRLVAFLRSARCYYRDPAVPPTAPDDDGAVTRTATEQSLAAFKSKVVHCRRPADTATFLAHWHGSFSSSAR